MNEYRNRSGYRSDDYDSDRLDMHYPESMYDPDADRDDRAVRSGRVARGFDDHGDRASSPRRPRRQRPLTDDTAGDYENGARDRREREPIDRDRRERDFPGRDRRDRESIDRREREAGNREQRDAKRGKEPKAKEPKAPKQPKAPREPINFREWGVVKFLCNKRFHAVIGVALVFLAVYFAMAAISFLKTGAEDQSALSSLTLNQMAATPGAVGNAAGPVGAGFTQAFLVEGLGLGSLAAIVYLVVLGLALMGIRRTEFWSLTFKTLLVGVTLSIVLGLVSLWLSLDYNLGGYHGRYINVLMVSYIDWIGALLVSLLLLTAVTYVYITDITAFYRRVTEMRKAVRDKAEQRRMEMEADREKVRQAMAQADANEHEAAEEEHPELQAERHDDEPQRMVRVGFEDEPVEETDIYAIRPGEESEPETHADHPDVQAAGETSEASASETSETAPAPETDEETANGTPAAEAAQPAETATETVMAATAGGEGPTLEVVTNTIEAGHNGVESVYDPTAELSRFRMPSLDLLRDVPQKTNIVDQQEQEENKERITKTLNDYGISISHIHATVGPTVTLYEIIPAEGVRIAKIKRLEDDIAMSLAALGIRIIAPIPGRGTIGIEVPNKDPQTVSIRSILGSKKFQESKYQLPMAMGVTISNEVFIADLCKMPHLLVAGATGMGKSVGLNTIIASLLYKKHPAELKFVLIDPKMVEFSLYSVLERHYLAKLPEGEEAVVTSMDRVLDTLNSLCVEMDQRYMLLRDANVRSITEYNDRFIHRHLNPEKGHRYLPYIVMIVDEFADLIMTAGKEVEKPIARIAQKARAVGMHMIIATQRPSTNVITGLIKANFPGRMAFRVQQMVDSKTILDRTGANQLIGKGDMLISVNGSLERVQCAFIDTPEVQAICDHIDQQAGYEHAYFLPEPQIEGDGATNLGAVGDRDPLFEEAAEIVVNTGLASTSSLQRRYSIGYNRAGKIMDQMEAAGIVGPAQGGKPRQVLVDPMRLRDILNAME